MKYFVLSSNREIIEVNHYLQSPGIDQEFSRFIRREALGEVLVEPNNSKPQYLERANKLGFRWEPNADSGHVQYDYKANFMRQLVVEYARNLVHNLDMPIYEVNGANMFSLSHPVVDSYASLYGDRLYQFASGEQKVVMSYDASYPQFNLAGQAQLSYKHLPFAHFSISDCYRHEQSGELMLLLRQRRFFMPDIHPYFLDLNEAFAWFPKLQAVILQSVEQISRKYQVVIEIPSEEVWLANRHHIERIPQWLNEDVLVNILEDGNPRYWVVNVDYKLIDQLGQSREIACIQVDVSNAQRLGINYVDREGNRKHPVIIHSAIPGGIERYIYAALDNLQLPLPQWLNPVQLRLLPVNDSHVDFCRELVAHYAGSLRIEVDDRQVSIGAKIRRAHEDLASRSLVIGSKEVDNQIELHQAIRNQLAAVEQLPFLPRKWPAELSRQI